MSNKESEEITGNRGEWSELYTFLKLLADKKLYAADENLNRIEDIYFPILKILRKESNGNFEYIVNSNIRIVNSKTNKEISSISINSIAQYTQLLFEKIKSNTGTNGSFTVPEIETFMKDIYYSSLKAKSKDKKDITIKIHDIHTGYEPLVGFSIKSKLGSWSSLLNPQNATNFIYRLTGNINDDVMNEINAINKAKHRNFLIKRFEMLSEKSIQLKFQDIEDENFSCNLILIDSNMPLIISEMLKIFYKKNIENINSIVDLLNKVNPCNYNDMFKHPYYEYKVKKFLLDTALGMTPKSLWSGKYDASGGYIIVKEDGDILCYHLYNLNEFQNYLFNHTFLDKPSTKRYEYGSIYKDNRHYNIKLNLQIRFK